MTQNNLQTNSGRINFTWFQHFRLRNVGMVSADKLPLHSLNSLCVIIPVYSDLLLCIMPLGANLTFMGQISVRSTFEALTARPFGSSMLCVLCGIKGTEHRLSRMELLTRSGIIVDKTCDKSRLASDNFWHSRGAAARSAAFSMSKGLCLDSRCRF